MRGRGAILDTMPLVNTLHKAISLQGIDDALMQRAIDAVAVTASSYTSGVHWTFCHTARDQKHDRQDRGGPEAVEIARHVDQQQAERRELDQVRVGANGRQHLRIAAVAQIDLLLSTPANGQESARSGAYVEHR